MCNFEAYQSELVPCSHEDVDIDDQHDHQGHQDTAEEVEVHHVVQGNHSFEQALRQAIRAILDAGCVVQTCRTEPVSSFNNVNQHCIKTFVWSNIFYIIMASHFALFGVQTSPNSSQQKELLEASEKMLDPFPLIVSFEVNLNTFL